MNSRLIVKIGSESLENFNTSQKIDALVRDIRLHFQSTDILLVTSWAVQFGREVLWVKKAPDENKQVLAAVGWHHLMKAYSDRFDQVWIPVAWFLATHADIEDNIVRANTFKRTIEDAWRSGFLPIENENDPISTEEMQELQRGADNDRNALLLARLFQAKTIFIITSSNGVYRDAQDPDTRIPHLFWEEITPEFIASTCSIKSWIGTGGMASKLEIARLAGKDQIVTHISDGLHSRISNMRNGGTTIFPGNKSF